MPAYGALTSCIPALLGMGCRVVVPDKDRENGQTAGRHVLSRISFAHNGRHVSVLALRLSFVNLLPFRLRPYTLPFLYLGCLL